MDLDVFLDLASKGIQGFGEAIEKRLISLGKKPEIEIKGNDTVIAKLPKRYIIIKVIKWYVKDPEPKSWEIEIKDECFECKISRKVIKFKAPHHGVKIKFKPAFDYAIISDLTHLFTDLYYLIKDWNNVASYLIDYISVLSQ
jgi:hypothetical protein